MASADPSTARHPGPHRIGRADRGRGQVSGPASARPATSSMIQALSTGYGSASARSPTLDRAGRVTSAGSLSNSGRHKQMPRINRQAYQRYHPAVVRVWTRGGVDDHARVVRRDRHYAFPAGDLVQCVLVHPLFARYQSWPRYRPARLATSAKK